MAGLAVICLGVIIMSTGMKKSMNPFIYAISNVLLIAISQFMFKKGAND
ncbi:MAG: hypothetical protein R3B93_23280 [Bacteroidia bacterium]